MLHRIEGSLHTAVSGRNIVLCAALWLAAAAAPVAAQPAPQNLHCQNATNPQGVTALEPQLSWSMLPSVQQRAYQVLVATTPEKLAADEGDLWDAGRVRSDQKTVTYRGKPLTSSRRCYWKVRIWGSLYTATMYSDISTWQMALLPFGRAGARPQAQINTRE